MKICFVCVEIFAWGKYGGFGRVARTVARELVKRGFEVSAVVPRRQGQKPVEELDGITVYSFPVRKLLDSVELYKKCDADIYHSEEPSIGTYLAKKAMPHKKHIAAFQDPKSFMDLFIEFKSPSINLLRSICGFYYENNFLVRRTVRNLDGVFARVKFIQEKIKQIYSLPETPSFLGNPVVVVDRQMKKAPNPTVCLIGRLDKRKRPEIFFEMAKKIPNVTFIAAGKSQDLERDKKLRETYSGLPNLELPGFIDQFSGDKLSKIFERSWILVNTSTREGLPNAFLEALACRCAILSQANPEDVAERFGYHVKDGDFEKGLKELLHQNQWAAKGEAGYRYVSEHYELKSVIDRHVELYKKLI